MHQIPFSCWRVELKGCPSTKLYALLLAFIDYCWPYCSSTVKYLTGYSKFKPSQQVLQILYLKASDKRNVELYLCSVGSTIQLGSLCFSSAQSLLFIHTWTSDFFDSFDSSDSFDSFDSFGTSDSFDSFDSFGTSDSSDSSDSSDCLKKQNFQRLFHTATKWAPGTLR